MEQKKERRIKGMGNRSIRKTKDGTEKLVMRVTIDGKRYKKTFGIKEKKKADKWAMDMQHNHAIGTLEDPNNITFKTYVKHWHEHMKSQVEDTTLKGYMSIVKNHLIPAFGSKKIKAIKEVMLNTFFDTTLTKKGLAPNTKRNVRRVLHEILDLARKEKIIGFNPLIDIAPIKGANANTRKSLTKEQAMQLLQGAKDYYEKKKNWKNTNVSVYPCIALILTTGLRLGETLALQWKNIEKTGEGNALIHIQHSVTKEGELKGPKTVKSNRTLPINKEVLDLCLSLNDGMSSFIFHTATGTPISLHNMERSLKAVCKYSNIDFKVVFHELRHTLATLALDDGADIADISNMLGHADISTTYNFYVHPSQKGLEKVSSTISNTLDFIEKK